MRAAALTYTLLLSLVPLIAVCLAALSLVIDIKKHQGAWTYPWKVFGSNAIFAYAFAELLSIVLEIVHVGGNGTSVSLKEMICTRVFFAIVDKPSGRAVGYASLMRIDVTNRVIEVGNILYTPALQRTAGATEAMYLLARYVFEELGYRRYEWKCNALNEPSRKAALRLGFTFEGIFRQHFIVKGRNRDTAWFSMLDSEWPAIKADFEHWLDPANFDAAGRQKTPLRLASQPG